MAGSNIEQKIRQMNREILRLKTAHPVAANMITYYYEFTFDNDSDNQNHQYEISYASGTQPILTVEAYSNRSWELLFGEVANDKQIMFDMDASHSNDEKFGIISTRQIIAIRKLQ